MLAGIGGNVVGAVARRPDFRVGDARRDIAEQEDLAALLFAAMDGLAREVARIEELDVEALVEPGLIAVIGGADGVAEPLLAEHRGKAIPG